MKKNILTYLRPEAEYGEALLPGALLCVSGDGEIDDVTSDDWGSLT